MSKKPMATMPASARKTRCAIYTRKSTDEGLDKEYNTLDAQRENNRLTGETNGILKGMSGKLDKLRGKPQAAFG